MSKFLPPTAVAREQNMQAVRKQKGLKSGFYIKYPSNDAIDYFVVRASRLFTDGGAREDEQAAELRGYMDRQLAMIAMHRAEQAAKKEQKSE